MNSYSQLAQSLQALALKLDQHAPRLEGAALAKASASFTKQLATFNNKVDAAIRGADPSVEAIQNLLKSPAKKLLKAPVWEKLLKQVHRAQPESEKAAGLQKQFLRLTLERQNAEAALHALQQQIQILSLPPAPPPKEKAALQTEFVRLGSLSEEDARIELAHRWTLSSLKNLAKHNAIVVSPKIQRPRLEREILYYARRAHANLAI